jgi:hypothetical protein
MSTAAYKLPAPHQQVAKIAVFFSFFNDFFPPKLNKIFQLFQPPFRTPPWL